MYLFHHFKPSMKMVNCCGLLAMIRAKKLRAVLGCPLPNCPLQWLFFPYEREPRKILFSEVNAAYTEAHYFKMHNEDKTL